MVPPRSHSRPPPVETVDELADSEDMVRGAPPSLKPAIFVISSAAAVAIAAITSWTYLEAHAHEIAQEVVAAQITPLKEQVKELKTEHAEAMHDIKDELGKIDDSLTELKVTVGTMSGERKK